jgi:hypothetical protein
VSACHNVGVKAALALALCVAAAGCLRDGGRDGEGDGECARDDDCDGECTRTHECVEAGTAIRVEVEWTIAGAAASETSCGSIGELEVIFYELDEEVTNYVPIPCPIGSSTYDKMPPRIDRVEMLAYGDGGDILDSQSADVEPTGTTAVTFDLQP